MQAFIVKRGWLEDEGRRLDASTYSSGGLDARDRVRGGPWKWAELRDLSEVFNRSRFVRTYVSEANRGIPYLTGSEMLMADLAQGTTYLSRNRTTNANQILVRSGWILVSCSGTVGRTVYVRPEMDGMLVSHDVMRIVTRSDDVLQGYLWAFLSSRLAQAMIRQRSYGSVVEHIEPQHLADIPTPVPEESDQVAVHELVSAAATARSEAREKLDAASAHFDSLAGQMRTHREHARAIGLVRKSSLSGRLDAFHHVGWASEAVFDEGDRVDEVAEVISTPRVPRVYVRRGVPFLSGIDAFNARPTSRVLLASHVADAFSARVKSGDIAIQGSGQRYGLLGRPAFLGRRLDGWAASHDLFRIRAVDELTMARLYVFLRSEAGHRAMLRHSYGTSVPHVNPDGIAEVRVPDLPDDLLASALRALHLREEADRLEDEAIGKVESWLA